LDSDTISHGVGIGHRHCNVGTKAHDDTLSDGGHQPAGNTGSKGSSWVSGEHEEGVSCTLTEANAIDGNLHVGVLANKLGALVKAPDHVSDAGDSSLRQWVLRCDFFLLFGKHLENKSQHRNNGNDHTAKSEGTSMSLECPLDGSVDGSGLGWGVRILIGEVPEGAHRSNHELHHGNEVGDDPEESEKENPEHPVGLIGFLERGEHILRLDVEPSTRVKEHASENEPDHDGDHAEIGNERCDHNSWLSGDKLSGNSHYLGSDLDILPHAANETGIQKRAHTRNNSGGHRVAAII